MQEGPGHIIESGLLVCMVETEITRGPGAEPTPLPVSGHFSLLVSFFLFQWPYAAHHTCRGLGLGEGSLLFPEGPTQAWVSECLSGAEDSCSFPQGTEDSQCAGSAS